MNSSFRELFYSPLTPPQFHSVSLKVQMASFSPDSVAVPQVCTAILGIAHCWETTNTKNAQTQPHLEQQQWRNTHLSPGMTEQHIPNRIREDKL
jgi:hypothetical protein